MQRSAVSTNSTEARAVADALEVCRRLNLKPEDLGLRKGRDGTYQLTYVTILIFRGIPEKLGLSA